MSVEMTAGVLVGAAALIASHVSGILLGYGPARMAVRAELVVPWVIRGAQSPEDGDVPTGLRGRDAGEGVLAELLVLVGDRRVERQILGRDDLVGIDVVAEDVGAAGDEGLHA